MAHLMKCMECQRVFRCDACHEITKLKLFTRLQACRCPDELFHGVAVYAYVFRRVPVVVYPEQNLNVDAPFFLNPPVWPWKDGPASLEIT